MFFFSFIAVILFLCIGQRERYMNIMGSHMKKVCLENAWPAPGSMTASASWLITALVIRNNLIHLLIAVIPEPLQRRLNSL